MQHEIRRTTSCAVAPDSSPLVRTEDSPYSVNTYWCGLSPAGGHGGPYPTVPNPFTPCRAPAGPCPSPTLCVSGEIPNITQCTKVPPGAFGSVMNNTYSATGLGLDHCSNGERPRPSHVYRDGMSPPAGNDALDRGMAAAAWDEGSCGTVSLPVLVLQAERIAARAISKPRRIDERRGT